MSRRYFAYIRVSTTKQGERGSSLFEQKNAITTYAARNGLKITEWFEEMETAAKQGRRQFSRMLARLEKREADGILIHKIDRSARNLRDWSALGDLIDRGLDVRFVTDNFDLLSRGGRLSADIQAVVAADYVRNLRDEVRKGIYGRLKQGILPFKAPLGYLDTGGGKVKMLDPVSGPLVRHLFERYATNTIGFHDLQREITAKGLRTLGGKPIGLKTMTRVLNNPFYMGVIRLMSTGECFAGAHEPLIATALFDRVQAILRGKTVPRAKKHRFLLRQLVKCGHCGSRSLTGELQKGNVYYRCHGQECTGVSWRGDKLERVLLDRIGRSRLDAGVVGDIGELIKQEIASAGHSPEQVKQALTLRLQNLDGRISRLTDLLIDGAVDREGYNERRESLLKERQEVLELISSSDERPPLQRAFEMFELQNSKLLRYEILEDDEKREVIEIVCSNFVADAENPVITLRSPFQEMAQLAVETQCALSRDDLRTEQVQKYLSTRAQEEAEKKRKARLPVPVIPHVSGRHPPETGATLH